MKTKIATLAIGSLCIFHLSLANAQSGYPAEQGYQVSSGYPSEQGYQASPGYPAEQGYQAPQPPTKKHHDKNKFSFNVNVPGNNEGIVISNGWQQKTNQPTWVRMHTGDRLPHHAVVGGNQPNPPATLFVCRANYRGGVHPGKLFNGRCNIGWGGNEISLSQYEVLVSRKSVGWVSASFGAIPPHAIQGGYQHDGPLYICQANYNGGIHSGKVVGQNCNFGWGGKEISVPYYKVLVK